MMHTYLTRKNRAHVLGYQPESSFPTASGGWVPGEAKMQ
jgi:hypothetical protein